MMRHTAIALGGNIANALGAPHDHIARAMRAFGARFDNVMTSGVYLSKPVGVIDQPDFYNAVLLCDSDLSPLDLLDFCQDLEQKAGRVRLRHWGERSLDVDIAYIDGVSMDAPRLTLPHPHYRAREFVLLPLYDLVRRELLVLVNDAKWQDCANLFALYHAALSKSFGHAKLSALKVAILHLIDEHGAPFIPHLDEHSPRLWI